MSKYCTKCGTKLADDNLFCGSCGAKQEVIASEYKTDGTGTSKFCTKCGLTLSDNSNYCTGCGKKQNNSSHKKQCSVSKKIVIIAVAIIAIIAVFLTVFLLCGRSYKTTIREYINASFEANGKAMIKLFPDEVIDYELYEIYELEEYGNCDDSIEIMTNVLSNNLQEDINTINDVIGEKWKYSYKILEVYNKSGKNLNETIESYEDIPLNISASKLAKVQVSIESESFTASDVFEISVIKVGRSWYIDDYDTDFFPLLLLYANSASFDNSNKSGTLSEKEVNNNETFDSAQSETQDPQQIENSYQSSNSTANELTDDSNIPENTYSESNNYDTSTDYEQDYSNENNINYDETVDYSMLEISNSAIMRQYEGINDTYGCFKVYDIADFGGDYKTVFFEADWYRLTGFGGVAEMYYNIGMFEINCDGAIIIGSFDFSDDYIMLCIEESTLPYLDPGVYEYSYDCMIDRSTTANHNVFFDFLQFMGCYNNYNWEYLGSPYEIFSVPTLGVTEIDMYKLISPTNGSVLYYACEQSKEAIYEITPEGILFHCFGNP